MLLPTSVHQWYMQNTKWYQNDCTSSFKFAIGCSCTQQGLCLLISKAKSAFFSKYAKHISVFCIYQIGSHIFCIFCIFWHILLHILHIILHIMYTNLKWVSWVCAYFTYYFAYSVAYSAYSVAYSAYYSAYYVYPKRVCAYFTYYFAYYFGYSVYKFILHIMLHIMWWYVHI